jgi:hypothetical protein
MGLLNIGTTPIVVQPNPSLRMKRISIFFTNGLIETGTTQFESFRSPYTSRENYTFWTLYLISQKCYRKIADAWSTNLYRIIVLSPKATEINNSKKYNVLNYKYILVCDLFRGRAFHHFHPTRTDAERFVEYLHGDLSLLRRSGDLECEAAGFQRLIVIAELTD